MNVFNHPRGTVCVARAVGMDGHIEWLRIHDQQWFKEWTGCFSVL